MDYSKIPAGMPPAGQAPNFIDPVSLSPVYRGIIYSFVPLMFIFLLLRLYTCVTLWHKIRLDDVLCILAAGCIISYCGTFLPNLDHPLGRHLWDVPISDITDRYLMYSTVMLVLFFLGTMFVKLALLTLYLRLFNIDTLAMVMIWVGMACVTLFYTIAPIVLLVECVPRGSQTWLETTFVGNCTPVQNGVSKGSGIFGLISDLYILAIPLWLVSHLTLPPGRKAGVLAVFLTGLMACGCSIAGVVLRYLWDQNDGTWSYLYITGIMELSIGNIVACMPILTSPLKSFVSNVAVVWKSISSLSRPSSKHSANNSHTLLEYNSNDNQGGEKLPQIPKGTLSGVRTFIRRAYQSTTGQPQTGLKSGQDLETNVTMGSVDVEQDYHVYLKTMRPHSEADGRSSRPSS